MAIFINKISKKYKEPVLKDLSLTFPNYGLVCVLGKSGCGKSTLIHTIGTIERIDSGEIVLDYNRIDNLKGEKQRKFLNETISFAFQHYQLIEDQNMTFNVMLPLLIKGMRHKDAFNKAFDALVKVGFDGDFQKKLVNTCSGGEKQRIALARSMINNPRILLADEPTGALDTVNSMSVMKILKDYSRYHLVIMVTHNKSLANKYADRIINFNKNKIEVKEINSLNKEITFKNKKFKKGISSWIEKFITHNLKKRFKRNIVATISLSISLIFSFILIGFSIGSKSVIDVQSIRQFDVGVSNLSIKTETQIEGSALKLVQETRLSKEELEDFIYKNDYLEYFLNYDYLVQDSSYIKLNEELLDTFSYNPVCSFTSSYNPNFLIEGRLPKDNLEEVVINKKAYNYLFKKLSKSPIYEELDIENSKEIITYVEDETDPYITDYFEYKKKVKIVGVVDELDFLSTPKIYYSYIALDNYMDEYLLNNLSKKLNEDYSYKRKIEEANNTSELSGYSHKVFLKDYSDFHKLESLKSELYQLTNSSMQIKEAISSFILATTMGMELFLAIAILGSVFILGITSFSSYSQDQHQNAILQVLGANKEDIFSIYVFESLFIGIVSFFISVLISIFISPLINSVLLSLTGFSNLITIPIKSYLNRRYFLLILIFFITVLVCVLSSYLPISLSKKTSLSKELKEE